jgi:hypothetical protein
LVIAGICTSKRGQEKMEENAKANGIEYPVARDPEEKSAKAWAVLSLTAVEKVQVGTGLSDLFITQNWPAAPAFSRSTLRCL